MAILSCLKPRHSSKPKEAAARAGAVSGKSTNERSFAERKIRKELSLAKERFVSQCSFGVVGDDMFKWQGIIIGPSGTPFEGGVFFLSIQFTDCYPFKPPIIKFQTKVYHPNISEDGTIHVDILGNNWSPALSIEKILLSICSLLPDPNAIGFHNPICHLYQNDRKSYNQKAREWTIKYAMK